MGLSILVDNMVFYGLLLNLILLLFVVDTLFGINQLCIEVLGLRLILVLVLGVLRIKIFIFQYKKINKKVIYSLISKI